MRFVAQSTLLEYNVLHPVTDNHLMALSPGTIINHRYRILSVLGQGGMGFVYQAEDTVLGVSVAVKENLFLSEEYSRQFEREAKILAGLRHASLPHVSDYFTITGQGQYLIMDYIEGEDLRERIERLGLVPVKDVIRIGVAVCDALHYLHTRKESILHRDIKPGNIKISPEGNLFLVDFGLAKIMRGDQVTTDGARAMTPGYSPPEQYGTARTDPRSDIYSLGATMYAAITGIIPEDGLDRATGKSKLTPIRELQPSVDRKISNAIEKSLEIDPEDRYQTAAEFRKALIDSSDLSRLLLDELKISLPPDNPMDSFQTFEPIPEDPAINKSKRLGSKPRKPSKKKKKKVLPLVLLLLLAGTLIGTIYLRPSLPMDILALIITPTAENTPIATTSILASNPNQATPTQTEVIALPQETYTPTNTSLPAVSLTPSLTPTLTRTTTPSITPVGGGMGQIAFVSDRTGSLQIWQMKSDGSSQEQLTNMTMGACQPAWSPDGMMLAFISPCFEKNNELYPEAKIYILDLMDASASPVPLEISSEEGDFDPAWSPDGNRIAFTSLRIGTAHIFVYNFEEESLQEISDTRFADIHPAWNPDGTQLAVGRKIIYTHIFILSDKGFTQYQLSSNGDIEDYWPNWSPNGKSVIFSRTTVSPSVPFLVTLDEEDRGTGKEARIPKPGSSFNSPIAGAVFSEDGAWIVFESWPDGRNHDIFIMTDQGEEVTRLTTDPGFDFDPAWRPTF